MQSQIIFDFNTDSDITNWNIVDDIVMGGKSFGTFKLNDDGFGVFQGNISLENYGGFSSVRFRFSKIKIKKEDKISIKLKGDGKDYQLRIKDKSDNHYSYVMTFSTSGEWQEIEIPIKNMFPKFRGKKLDQPNFSHDYIEEISFLIGNKKNEKFKLLLDKIVLV